LTELELTILVTLLKLLLSKSFRASSFTRFLDHTQRRTTVGRTPLYEWSARRRDLYQHTTLTTDKHPCPRRDSRPQSQQIADLRLRLPGHWDRRPVYWSFYLFFVLC